MRPVNVIVDDDELVPGTMVGEFCVDGHLGEGGMGTVYAATHPVIAKRAAIKVLHPALSVNREAVERFVQEARSVNQIGHPNIVDIFAFGTLADGRSYFVMERLHGQTLRDRMKMSRLSLDETLSVLETMTLALEAAHDCGVVHRDLKPDNVFLVDVKNDRPLVKLLDFGIAKLLGDDSTLTERTRTGNLLGTPGYISPEQARGYAVDHRTDIYALGAMAFELVTGSLPFPCDNGADMIAKHLHAPPPSATAVNPHVPPGLDKLITRMMAKEPGNRPTLPSLRDQLRAYRGHTMPGSAGTNRTIGPMGAVTVGGPAPSVNLTTSAARRSRAWGVVVGAVLVAISGGVVFMAMRGDDRRSPDSPPASNPASNPAASATSNPAASNPGPTIEPIVEPSMPATKPAAEGSSVVAKPRAEIDGSKPTTNGGAAANPGNTSSTKPGMPIVKPIHPGTKPSAVPKPATGPKTPSKDKDDDDAPL